MNISYECVLQYRSVPVDGNVPEDWISLNSVVFDTKDDARHWAALAVAGKFAVSEGIAEYQSIIRQVVDVIDQNSPAVKKLLEH